MTNETIPTWPCGKPKSQNNVFNWRRLYEEKQAVQPKSKGRTRVTEAEMKKTATRVNKHDPITQRGSTFDQVQKLKRTAI